MSSQLPLIRTVNDNLNNAMGEHGGFRRGEMVSVIGLKNSRLPHDLMIDLHLGCGLVNIPHMIDPSKKPLVLQISSSNNIHSTLSEIHNRFLTLTKSEDGQFNHDKSNGYTYMTLYIPDISSFTLDELFTCVGEFEKDGYELHQISIMNVDKMSHVRRDGRILFLQEMIRDMREFFSLRGTLTIIGLTINDEAIHVSQVIGRKFLEQVCQHGMYGNDVRINQEVDCELFISAEITETSEVVPVVYVGKHRGFKESGVFANYNFDDPVLNSRGRFIKDMTVEELVAAGARTQAQAISDVTLPTEFDIAKHVSEPESERNNPQPISSQIWDEITADDGTTIKLMRDISEAEMNGFHRPENDDPLSSGYTKLNEYMLVHGRKPCHAIIGKRESNIPSMTEGVTVNTCAFDEVRITNLLADALTAEGSLSGDEIRETIDNVITNLTQYRYDKPVTIEAVDDDALNHMLAITKLAEYGIDPEDENVNMTIEGNHCNVIITTPNPSDKD